MLQTHMELGVGKWETSNLDDIIKALHVKLLVGIILFLSINFEIVQTYDWLKLWVPR